MIISVSATIKFDYDTEDGLVSNREEAIADMREHLLAGPSIDQFDILVTGQSPSWSMDCCHFDARSDPTHDCSQWDKPWFKFKVALRRIVWRARR